MKTRVVAHRTEKLSTGMLPGIGDAVPQSKFTAVSQRSFGVPVRSLLSKYAPVHWLGVHARGTQSTLATAPPPFS